MEIIFNPSKPYQVNVRLLRKLAGFVSNKDVVVSVSFIPTSRIRKLNKKYRSKDMPTDVLSFSLNEGRLLGDILISPAVARGNAKKYNVSYMEEIARLFVHGLLHLIGHVHGEKMFALQEKILEKGGIYHA